MSSIDQLLHPTDELPPSARFKPVQAEKPPWWIPPRDPYEPEYGYTGRHRAAKKGKR